MAGYLCTDHSSDLQMDVSSTLFPRVDSPLWRKSGMAEYFAAPFCRKRSRDYGCVIRRNVHTIGIMKHENECVAPYNYVLQNADVTLACRLWAGDEHETCTAFTLLCTFPRL